MGSAVDPASFRDPTSAVFHADGRVFRGLTAHSAADLDAVMRTEFFARLVDEGSLVRTTPVSIDAPPSPRGDVWAAVVEHERIDVVTYPYEWPYSMLRAAALCHLDVLLAALDEGYSLKDGTAYNIQFVGTRPVFIDVGSFEPVNGPWPGYRQFCRTMLFPLLVHAHLGVPSQALLRGRLDGLEPREVHALFRGRRAWRAGVFRNVVLQASLEARTSGASTEQTKARLASAGFGAELQKATARKLRKLVAKLDPDRKRSTWSDYRTTCSYTESDTAAKRVFVERVASRIRPHTALDLGANDGAFSDLVSAHAGQVVAVDLDELVVDRLARRLRGEGPANVLPLVIDLADPSPAMGWDNRERSRFADRVRPDLVLALALVHHLAIGANVPLPEVVDWLAGFGAPTVVEFVHPSDPMAVRLLANKPAGLFDDYRLDRFEALLGARMQVLERETLASGTRTLFATAPR